VQSFSSRSAIYFAASSIHSTELTYGYWCSRSR